MASQSSLSSRSMRLSVCTPNHVAREFCCAEGLDPYQLNAPLPSLHSRATVDCQSQEPFSAVGCLSRPSDALRASDPPSTCEIRPWCCRRGGVYCATVPPLPVTHKVSSIDGKSANWRRWEMARAAFIERPMNFPQSSDSLASIARATVSPCWYCSVSRPTASAWTVLN